MALDTDVIKIYFARTGISGENMTYTFLGHVSSPVSSLFLPVLINVQAHKNIASKCVTGSLNGKLF